MTQSGRILLIVDGGSRGNPGPLYVASYAELHINGEVVTCGPIIRDLNMDGTNNESEYLAIVNGIDLVSERINDNGMATTDFHLVILSDSQLVVRQVNGIYKVEADHLESLRDRVLNSLSRFGSYTLSWVPRDFTNAYLGC